MKKSARTLALALLAALVAKAETHQSIDDIIINELMASNAGVVMSPAYNFDSWIEFYNPGTQAVNLAGLYLSNDPSNLTRWKMPNDIGSIPAKGFLVMWLGSDDIKDNHAPFKLDCDGGTICLSDRNGQLITSVDYPAAMSRTAYARTTDGGNEWNWTAYPTPKASNTTTTFASKRLDAPVVSLGSQLFTGTLNVSVDIPEGATLMYTTDGSTPTVVTDTSGNPILTWNEWIKNGNCEGQDDECFVCRDGDGSGDIHRITDGVGVDGSRGIKVHAIDNPENDWDTQFFIYTPTHIFQSGEQYRFRMMARADKPGYIYAQAHRTPGDYIYWDMLNGGYNISTEWQEFFFEGTITDDQAGDGRMQSIAFNLNVDKFENTFYFDNISWESYSAVSTPDNSTARASKDGRFTINSTTSYVFRLFQDGFLPSVPVTRSYIKTSDTYTIPVVSIVGDERYFTDPMWGIDIKGQNGIPGNADASDQEPKNWNMPWDRPVNFSYISPTDGMLFNQDVNISVSGGWTRSITPRSMKLKSNKVFDGQNRFDYSFFPQKPFIRSKTLLVRNGGNDVWANHARFTDPALTTIIQRSGIDLDVQSTVQVVEYINGKRKGVLNLREPNNDKFVYANFGYDDDEIDMFENKKFKNGTDEAYNRLCQLSERIGNDGVYDEVKTLLDIDEFTNYMATELYLGNDDWPDNNVKGYRSQHDGRFRFICFDLDYSFNPWGRRISSLNDYTNIPMVKLFLNLLKHDEYRKKFIDTFCIIGGSVFERERAIAIVDELADAMRPMAQYDGHLPDNAASKIKNQLNNRVETLTNQLQQYSPMKLSGVRKQTVQLNADIEGATLLINGLKVPYASFNGRLFAPVTLEAKAPAGYTFAGWKKSSSSLITLMNLTDSWKYYDQGEAANGWQSASFDDSSWASGKAPLGYSMNGVTTTVGYGSNSSRKNPTTYFRNRISLSSAPTNNDLFLLNYEVDDGFVIYVNGTEAARVNMRQGEVNFDTFSQTYADSTPLTGSVELSPSLFHSGSNVIAVEVHNTSYTSSDLYWAAELQTTVSSSPEEIVSTEAVIDLPDDARLSLVATFTPMTADELEAEGITPIRINEVSAANGIYVNDHFKRNDWVELYNTTDAPIDIKGMYLSDNPNKPLKYQITGGDNQASTIVPAHGFLIVWCDNLEPLSQLHATFKLAAEGGDVLLTAADQSWTDRLTYVGMSADQTAGRYPDGAADVYTMNIPTIAQQNITSSYATFIEQHTQDGIIDLADESISLTARYTTDRLMVRSMSDGDISIRISNLAGQSFGSHSATINAGEAEVSLDYLPTGVYVVLVADHQGHKTSCKFIKK